jgi:F-type H+-transporting ATPase subunit delta
MAGRYALALFSLAQESGQGQAVAGQLAQFDSLASQSPDLTRLIRSPVFSAGDQLKALNAVMAQAGIDGIAANFVRLVAAKRRLFAIRDMIATYFKLNDAARGVTRAEVTAAQPLSDAHVAALKDALRATTGRADVDISVKVNPDILGGLIVKLGSRMVDGSLRTKLNTIRTRMKEVG